MITIEVRLILEEPHDIAEILEDVEKSNIKT
jgi:hypothetical protein